MSKWLVCCAIAATLLQTDVLPAQLVISGNENKIELTSGAPAFVENAQEDSVSFLDFSTFPPRVEHLLGITNTVIGPPSNIAIAPNGEIALLANSLQINRQATPDPWEPAREVHVLDLSSSPPKISATVTAGRQPSGISISPDGRTALVANRADGTLTVIQLDGNQARVVETVEVCDPAESLSDVAIHPNGKMALASVQKGGYLAVLQIDELNVTYTGHKVSAYGQPYRVVITPDGQLGLTAGQGDALNGIDTDAVTVVDLTANPTRAIDHISVGAVPESIEISGDGRWLAVVIMAGSNYPESDARHSPHGQLVLLRRDQRSYKIAQRYDIGRIPEGVAFTSDDQYLLVQCHPDREIWAFRMGDDGATDTGSRISVPGMPSSMRAAR